MKLFKYVTANRISILKDGYIRFTQPADLNDPFEIRPIFVKPVTQFDKRELFNRAFRDAFRELHPLASDSQIEQMANSLGPMLQQLIEPFFDQGISAAMAAVNQKAMPDAASKVLGVLSLSATATSSLLWAHYAQSYQGFAIEFDTDHDFFKAPPGVASEVGDIRQVIYSDVRPKLDLSSKEGTVDFLFTKPSEWAYEMEWRLVRPLSLADKIVEQTPYPVHLFKVPIGAVTGVIFGYRATKELFEGVRSLVDTSEHLHDCALSGVRTKQDSFSLEVFSVRDWRDLNVDEVRSEAAKQEFLSALRRSNRLADLFSNRS